MYPLTISSALDAKTIAYPPSGSMGLIAGSFESPLGKPPELFLLTRERTPLTLLKISPSWLVSFATRLLASELNTIISPLGAIAEF